MRRSDDGKVSTVVAFGAGNGTLLRCRSSSQPEVVPTPGRAREADAASHQGDEPLADGEADQLP